MSITFIAHHSPTLLHQRSIFLFFLFSSISFRAPAITAIARLVPTGAALGELAMNMAGNQTNTDRTETRYLDGRSRKNG